MAAVSLFLLQPNEECCIIEVKNITMKLLLLLLLLNMACQEAPEKIIGLNQNIHHDDFEYVVRSVQVLDSLGSLKSAKRQYYIVTFQVENQAKRVEHPWSSATAYLSDEQGHTYENQTTLQQFYQQMWPFNLKENFVTPAGQTDSTVLVFEVPRGTKPYLQVRGETLMGDFFDGGQFEKMKIRLF